jgi:hypothetical protein
VVARGRPFHVNRQGNHQEGRRMDDNTHDNTHDDNEIRDEPPAPEGQHVGEESQSIAEQWADEYEPGTELFCATFDATDFDPEYGDEYPDGTTVAVKRCLRRPTPGWVRQHAHMSDLERTFVLLERHCSDKAIDILDSLVEEQWDKFVEAWGRDGGLIEGKSRRLRRSARR